MSATILNFPAPPPLQKPARGKLLFPEQRNMPRFSIEEWGPEDRGGGETRLRLTVREYRKVRAFLRQLKAAQLQAKVERASLQEAL